MINADLEYPACARELAPSLRERAGETAELRRITRETAADLHDSGLMRIVQPRAHGGGAAAFDVFVQTLIELAHGCPSTAWVCGNLATHSWLLGMFGAQAQEDIWGDDPKAVAVGTLAPTGSVRVVDGGYELSGSWSFASGCDLASWGLFGGMDTSALKGPPVRLVFLVPRDAWSIEDTWFTGGLCGTGSKTLHMAPTFVPRHRAVAFDALNRGTGPGADLPGAGPLSRLPLLAAWPYALAATAIGAAGALTLEFEQSLRDKLAEGAKASSGQVGPQLRLAESMAEVDAAALIARSATRALMDQAVAGDELSLSARSLHRRNHGWVVELAVRSANRIIGATGANGLYDSKPFGQLWRDVNAARAHHALVWDSPAENFARVRLGLKPNAKIL